MNRVHCQCNFVYRLRVNSYLCLGLGIQDLAMCYHAQRCRPISPQTYASSYPQQCLLPILVEYDCTPRRWSYSGVIFRTTCADYASSHQQVSCGSLGMFHCLSYFLAVLWKPCLMARFAVHCGQSTADTARVAASQQDPIS